MKRREDMLSSSSSARRETIPAANHQTKSIGCMSGIFHLVSKYQHRRKLLTSGKHDRSNISSSSPPNSKPKSSDSEVPENKALVLQKITPPSTDADFKRFSFDIPRSPTIPSEIRLSSSLDSSENIQRSPALVARLMGLDEFPASPSQPVITSSSEKRRKLMVALEKCDEDLKALKNIIEAIRSTNHNLRSSTVVEKVIDRRRSGVKSGARSGMINKCEVVKGRASLGIKKQLLFADVDGGDSVIKDKSCPDVNSEQPSPVSVLDQISNSPPSNHRRSPVHHQIGEKYKKLREDGNSFSFFQRITFEALPRLSGRRSGHDDQCRQSYFGSSVTNYKESSSSSPFHRDQGNKTKVESVNEVCVDAVWAERWELGRIGVVLEDYIFEELMEEIVRELGCCHLYSSSSSSLPFEACRKRLRF